MYTNKPWARMPTAWIFDGRLATDFTWGSSGRANRSAATAGLMLWIALVTRANEYFGDASSSIPTALRVMLTYNALKELTGLSRSLISTGLSALEETGLIKIESIGRASRYELKDFNPMRGWCKLPSRALYTRGKYKTIDAFKHFQKRTVCELDALKLYLYFAAIRQNQELFSQAKFATIQAHTGVPEKRIARAHSFLLATGLLAQISKEPPKNGEYFPNHYYLLGYMDLFVGKK